MVKLVLTGIWVCIVTLAAVYFSVHLATAPAPSPEETRQSKLELVKGETITVPVIDSGAVHGYFIAKLSFMMNKELIKTVALPLTELTSDELFTLLVGNKLIDIGNIKSFDPQAFRETVKADINKHLGGDYIDQVMLEQLDYLSKDEINGEGGQQKRAGKPVNVVPPAATADAASPAH